MIIPIKCFTCGTVLADKYAFYCEEVRRRKQVQSGSRIDKVVYLTSQSHEKTINGEVLDMPTLNLKKMCCRRHMLTHVDIE
jgi:DNA-directed RNA polymerase subunit N (RpoN/RPB10)